VPTGPYQSLTYRLNQAAQYLTQPGGTITPQFFVDQTGLTVDVLWEKYQASF
jgi:hypothetical protein